MLCLTSPPPLAISKEFMLFRSLLDISGEAAQTAVTRAAKGVALVATRGREKGTSHAQFNN